MLINFLGIVAYVILSTFTILYLLSDEMEYVDRHQRVHRIK
ncbi:hypothetical protein [Weissella confusa]|nr:hypothetical protein [Weissella confusa]